MPRASSVATWGGDDSRPPTPSNSGDAAMASPVDSSYLSDVDPLAQQELEAFGTNAEDDPLPPPPRDPNAVAGGTDGANGAGVGAKRSLGAAGGPLARGKRPKNVKFSPAKTGKQLARRAAAPGSNQGDVQLPNNDFCDSCGGKGHFLCCEGGCLRSFHFQCLEPPLEIDEVPDESWFCKACRAAAHPPPRPPKGFFSDLIFKVETENPKAFTLTADLKSFFKNGKAPSSYLRAGPLAHLAHASRQSRLAPTASSSIPTNIALLRRSLWLTSKRIYSGRAIGQEDRDGYRLKDKNGRAIICYNCSEAASAPKHRRIISCDFCDQHWHLDCLDPPMTGMPPPTRKWMCPLHSDHVLVRYSQIIPVFAPPDRSTSLQPKKRIPKATTTINVEERNTPNNGDILVLPRKERQPAEEYEEMTVNRIRYQVPEQNIILDFWGKVVPKASGGKPAFKSRKARLPRKKDISGYDSGASSPLTDLTTSDDDEYMSDVAAESIKSVEQQPGPSALDNLALLAEVRYIDYINSSSASAGDDVLVNGGRTSPTDKGKAPRFPVAAIAPIPPFASPASAANSPSVARRRNSPSLSPAPRAMGTPLPELTVQNKEDLKALMHVRKMLAAQQGRESGRGEDGSRRATLFSFLDGAPIIPKLGFIKEGPAPWSRPWDPKSGKPPPPGTKPQPKPSASIAVTPSSALPVYSPSPAAPAPAAASTPTSTSHGAAVVQSESTEAASQLTLQSTPPHVEPPALAGMAAQASVSVPVDVPFASAPTSAPPSTNVPAPANLPSPFAHSMPFELPPFRPKQEPVAPSLADAMAVDELGPAPANGPAADSKPASGGGMTSAE
ncbi:SPOSA6832_01477 [Sporobolomyces salmonicolor]|uniref:SPOSA6832_01477-mRNA-1:cds n=1 Tax=Sporidiobolus salmonicolor TaxID=5005 RepID=A0A0D6EIT5_SPOSA|nr:SPOSA6832_01477 [Sporobolomyces salmonicolor]